MIKAVIFDLDGTLITSEDLIETTLKRCYTQITGAQANPETFRRARVRMCTCTEDRVFQVFCDVMELSIPPEELVRMYNGIQRVGYPEIGMTPGSERLIRHLHAEGVPMGIATNTPREKLALKTAHLQDVLGLIPHAVTLSEVAVGKPDPEIMRKAADLLQTDPAHCLVFDDAPKGIAAAKAAGMSGIGLTFRITPQEMPGADAYLPDLAAFDPAAWELPAFRD